jgi:hypothetical protein
MYVRPRRRLDQALTSPHLFSEQPTRLSNPVFSLLSNLVVADPDVVIMLTESNLLARIIARLCAETKKIWEEPFDPLTQSGDGHFQA